VAIVALLLLAGFILFAIVCLSGKTEKEKSMDPEYIITTSEKPESHLVDFGEVFKQRDHIKTITLLWNTNSYLVNVEKRFFLINGGRRMQVNNLVQSSKVLPFLIRRHQAKIGVGFADGDGGGEVSEHTLTHLLGLEAEVLGVRKEIMIHISTDGREWVWKDRR